MRIVWVVGTALIALFTAPVFVGQDVPDSLKWWRHALDDYGGNTLQLAVLICALLAMALGLFGPRLFSRKLEPRLSDPMHEQLREIKKRGETRRRPAPRPEERSFVDITPAELVGLFADHTSQQGAKLIEPYLGKWLRVTGPLGDVLSNRGFRSQVTFEKGSVFDEGYEPVTVYMYFERERWDDRLAVLRPGSSITVAGRIREVDRVHVHLEDCELVES
jgi:hypothetical protein